MSKVHLDSDVINNKINPNISSAKDQLYNGRKLLNDVYIPWDFVYRNTLKGYVNSIDTINSRLEKFDSWVNGAKNKLTQAEGEYKSSIEKIEVSEIKERPKAV